MYSENLFDPIDKHMFCVYIINCKHMFDIVISYIGEVHEMRRIHETRRNRRDVVRDERIILSSLIFITVAIILGCCMFGSIRTEAAPYEVSQKYYTSIQINSGDTLWTIADKYMTDEYADKNDYIREVCNINHISGDSIHSGQYLTVPYYVTVLASE